MTSDIPEREPRWYSGDGSFDSPQMRITLSKLSGVRAVWWCERVCFGVCAGCVVVCGCLFWSVCVGGVWVV